MFGWAGTSLLVASIATVPFFGDGAASAIAAGNLLYAAALAVFVSSALFGAGETSRLTAASQVPTRRLRNISLHRCR